MSAPASTPSKPPATAAKYPFKIVHSQGGVAIKAADFLKMLDETGTQDRPVRETIDEYIRRGQAERGAVDEDEEEEEDEDDEEEEDDETDDATSENEPVKEETEKTADDRPDVTLADIDAACDTICETAATLDQAKLRNLLEYISDFPDWLDV